MNAAINAALRYPVSSLAVRWMRWFWVGESEILEILPPCEVKESLAAKRRVVVVPLGRRWRR